MIALSGWLWVALASSFSAGLVLGWRRVDPPRRIEISVHMNGSMTFVAVAGTYAVTWRLSPARAEELMGAAVDAARTSKEGW